VYYGRVQEIFLGGYSKEISEFFFVSTSLVKVNLNGNFKNEFQVGWSKKQFPDRLQLYFWRIFLRESTSLIVCLFKFVSFKCYSLKYLEPCTMVWWVVSLSTSVGTGSVSIDPVTRSDFKHVTRWPGDPVTRKMLYMWGVTNTSLLATWPIFDTLLILIENNKEH